MGRIWNQYPRFSASKTSEDKINNDEYASLINSTNESLGNFYSLVNSNNTTQLTKTINSSIPEHKYFPSSLISCNDGTTKNYDLTKCGNRTHDLPSKEDRNVVDCVLLGLIFNSNILHVPINLRDNSDIYPDANVIIPSK